MTDVRHLYVHVPFCARRCTYCDFAIAVRPVVPVDAFVRGIERELEAVGRPDALRTVYLGGGTPSKLGPGMAALARVIGATDGVEEYTLEANPEDMSREVVHGWRAAGVNRISLGAQSFEPRVLEWMHRTHDAPMIADAVRAARAGGITNLSLDLIFSLPDALARDWRADLERAIALEPEHISLYGLTVEQGTPLGRQVLRGQTVAAPDARYADEYLLAHELLGAAGYRFYEVSNAARPGFEAVHNRAYWRHVPYLGLGPSAHSFDGTERWWNEPAYSRWQELVDAGQSPVAGRETLDAEALELERLYLGLRTVEGITLDAPLKARLLRHLDAWKREGWAVLSDRPDGLTHLALTPPGWLRLDVLVASV